MNTAMWYSIRAAGRQPDLEWVTPGHPLFEVVRADVGDKTTEDLGRGAVFYDIHRKEPSRLDVYTGAVQDGRGNVVHRRLFVVEAAMDGTTDIRQPTLFLDLVPVDGTVEVPDDTPLPTQAQLKQALIEQALNPLLKEVGEERKRETETILRHLKISLNELINRENLRYADLYRQVVEEGRTNLRLALGNCEEKLENLNARLEQRTAELDKERHCTIANIQHHGRAWVLPHPERQSPGIAPMVRDDEIERIAVEAAIGHEKARGWEATSVEKENRGFDLISRRPHPEDPQTQLKFASSRSRDAHRSARWGLLQMSTRQRNG